MATSRATSLYCPSLQLCGSDGAALQMLATYTAIELYRISLGIAPDEFVAGQIADERAGRPVKLGFLVQPAPSFKVLDD